MTADDAALCRLMRLAQDGDREAYRTLLRMCQTWLKGYFARRLMSSSLDDVVQETLLSVHAKRATYDPRRPFLPWLAAIARYRWVDHLRAHYRANEVELDEQTLADPQNPSIAARIGLDRLLKLLPDSQSDAIRLVKIEGLSIAEASDRTGQSQPLVKVNIHRGLKKLAQHIEQD
ncbi:MAG: sigma-70 family RNA polymerase sigma factor [Sphingomonas sp.]